MYLKVIRTLYRRSVGDWGLQASARGYNLQGVRRYLYNQILCIFCLLEIGGGGELVHPPASPLLSFNRSQRKFSPAKLTSNKCHFKCNEAFCNQNNNSFTGKILIIKIITRLSQFRVQITEINQQDCSIEGPIFFMCQTGTVPNDTRTIVLKLFWQFCGLRF